MCKISNLASWGTEAFEHFLQALAVGGSPAPP